MKNQQNTERKYWYWVVPEKPEAVLQTSLNNWATT